MTFNALSNWLFVWYDIERACPFKCPLKNVNYLKGQLKGHALQYYIIQKGNLKGHLKGIVKKTRRACPFKWTRIVWKGTPFNIISYKKSIWKRALKGIWCDIGRAFTIQERASLWGRYILERATFVKGHHDVDFTIALPFLSYISEKTIP